MALLSALINIIVNINYYIYNAAPEDMLILMLMGIYHISHVYPTR